MSTRLLNRIAGLLMMLTLGLVALAISASTERTEIQGPSALAVLPDGSVWLSVEDALWHLDKDGGRVAVADAATLGVGGRIGNLVVHPNGQLVAQVRNGPSLYFLDPKTGVIRSRFVPQWPEDMKRDGSDAINYAFHDDGRVAIANGGGHAVTLFDAKGVCLARTAPGTYEFTNGLWWKGGSLWTTDTNRQELVELDGGTLAVKSRVRLSTHTGDWQFLGMATPSRGKESIRTRALPLATIIRFADGMTEGHATDVFEDGSQLDYPAANALEPRDIKWRGNELMLVDNASFSIKRYSDNRISLADFGDAQVRAELAALLEKRQGPARKYDASLFGAVSVFLIGLALALLARSREKTVTLAGLNIDLTQLGTPRLSGFSLFAATFRLMWPTILGVIVLLESFDLLDGESAIAGLAPHQAALLGLAVIPLTYLLIAILQIWNLRRRQEAPETEAIFNLRAVQFLQTDKTFWKLRQPDELPQETLILNRTKGGVNWLVLTNLRLLVFVSNLKDRTLVGEYPLKDILRLHFLEPGEMVWRQKLQRFAMSAGALMRMDFRDGTRLDGFSISVQTARRIAAQLQAASRAEPTIDDMHRMQLDQARPRLAAERIRDASRHAIASLLVPGLGQWMQRRTGTAFFFFLAWLCALSIAVPVAWTLWTRLSSVSTRLILFSAGAYILICALASLDAWKMRERFNIEGK